jgi:hypothetical protein
MSAIQAVAYWCMERRSSVLTEKGKQMRLIGDAGLQAIIITLPWFVAAFAIWINERSRR